MSHSQRLHAFVRFTLAAAALAAALPAVAQQTPSKKTDTLEAVIVSAQKRDETLTEIPVAISAFTSTKRDLIGIDSVVDMTNFTPGFSYNSGQDRVSMRGIGRYTNQLGADSSVGVYEDGAFETFTVKAGNSSLYTDRIEVLRGPQGTLYGRSSIGGAVNIISRRPTKDWYSEFRFTYDNYDQSIIEGALSGPITDTLQFRLIATKLDQDYGYFKNVGGGPSSGNVRDEWVYEGQLAWQASDSDDFWLKVFGGGWSDGGGNAGGKTTNQVLVGPDGKTLLPGGVYPVNGTGLTTTNLALVPSLGVGFTAATVSSLNPTGVDPANGNIRNFYSNYPQTVSLRDYYGTVLHYTHHFGGADLKYIGAAQHYNYVENVEWGEGFQQATGLISYQNPGDAAATFPNSVLFYQEKHSLNTNEINLISTGDSPWQYVAGVYNFNEYYVQPEEIYMPGQAQLAAPLNVITFAPSPANPMRAVTYGEGDGGAKSLAGYGQVDWSFTQTWKATLGLRYSKDWKWGWDKGRLLAFNAPNGIGLDISELYLPLSPSIYKGVSTAVYDQTTGIATRRLEGTWNSLTGTAGLEWNPDKDTNMYFKYSRGFKSGGFNIGSAIVADNPETNPEHSNDYQIGYKQNFNNTFQLNVAVYYDQYYDAQVNIGVKQPGGNVATELYNLPEARTDGVEIETAWQATHGLQFIFNYGYNDTNIRKSGCIVDPLGDPTATLIGAQPGNCAAGHQDLKGNELPNAPKNKFALNGNYTFDFAESSLSFSASYIWRDKQYGSIFNRAYTEAPSWSQTDLRITYKTLQDHLTLIVYGKNVFNQIGYNLGARAVQQTDANGNVVGFLKNYDLTPPRIIGGELQYKF